MRYPTGTVTLIFTDLQGSTELWQALKDRFAPVLGAHNSLMRELIAAHDGYEVKTEGDAFMAAFHRASDAVKMALAAQEKMRAIAPPELKGELLIRIGVHTGEPICELDPTTGRMDYFGPFVNRSARVGSAGHGGQILISKATYEAAIETIEDAEAQVTDLGEHRLKGLSRAEHIYQVLPRSLAGRQFPPLKTLNEAPTNLPYQSTSFVGRKREWNEICELLTEGKTPLITITGPGGIGKTRLALRIGSEILDRFEGGVWFADLSEVRTADALAAEVAGAFGVPLTGADPPEKVVSGVLEFRKPLLLILDNFEQVVRHATGTVGLWMKRARQVRFLVTSRSLLGLGGEREYRLDPLPIPVPRKRRVHAGPPGSTNGAKTPEEPMSSYDVVRLFVERAREAKPGFDLTDENSDDVAEICAAVEGMPLALELAAARARIMTPGQIVSRLSQKFQLLRSSRRDLPARQQTLLGAIDWSYDLLTDWERSALCQACTFRGGFLIEAADEVIDLSSFDKAPPAIDAVEALRDHSLLSTIETPYGTRLRMYVAIREYAEEKALTLLGEEHRRALEERHAAHFTRYAQEWDARRGTDKALEAFDRLEQDAENLFAVHDRALARGDAAGAARAILAMAVTMAVRGLSPDRASRLEASLAALRGSAQPDRLLEVRLLNALCLACQDVGDWDKASSLADEAVRLAESVGQFEQLGSALIQQGEMHRLRGALETAIRCFDRAAEAFGTAGERAGFARALGGRGSVLWKQGEYDRAIEAFVRASEEFERLGNRAGVARNVGGRGIVLADRHDYDAALACYAEAESMHRLLGNRTAIARVLNNRAIVLQERGEHGEALRCFAEAESINRELGHKPSVARNIGSRGMVLEEQGDIDGAMRCFAEAEQMHRELGNRSGIAANVARRGRALLLKGQHAEAAAALREATKTFGEIGEGATRQAFDCDADLARAEAALGRKKEAEAAARAAIDLARRIGLDTRTDDSKLVATLEGLRAMVGGAAG